MPSGRTVWNHEPFFDYTLGRYAVIEHPESPAPPRVNGLSDFTVAMLAAYGDLALNTPVATVENAGSPRSSYSLDSAREVTFADTANVQRIYYTVTGSTPTDEATGDNILYDVESPPVISTACTLKWRAFSDDFSPSEIGSIAIAFVTATHPCAPVNLTIS
jgi:hypothetical protein